VNKWLGAALIVALIGIGAAFAVWHHDDDWGPRNGDVVTRSVAADGTETIVVHEGRDHGFFPFGIFVFPLVIFLTIFALRGLAFRGHSPGYGPWMRSGSGAADTPGWFEEWHRRAHSGTNSPPESGDRDQGSTS
jgi:hypothetical protein